MLQTTNVKLDTEIKKHLPRDLNISALIRAILAASVIVDGREFERYMKDHPKEAAELHRWLEGTERRRARMNKVA